MSATLEDIKRDGPALFALLDIDRPGKHRCPFHDDGNDSFSVGQMKDGKWGWRCFAGCGGGTIVDAYALVEGVSPVEAIRRLCGSSVPSYRSRPRPAPRPPAPRAEPVQPIVNDHAIYARFEPHFERTIRGDFNARLAKRRISIDTILKPFQHIAWDDALRAWLILVTEPGRYLGIKVHREKPFDGPKNYWLRLGTFPAEQPRHAAITFFPPVECFNPDEVLFLCPGELKAAAELSDGGQATATTAGESHRWTPAEIERFRGREVAMLFDDDAAGHTYRNKTRAALSGVVREFHAFSRGVKHD